eukprot:COSAG06_NODE_1595_length_8979_cov_126.558784_2_plen_79_part_00
MQETPSTIDCKPNTASQCANKQPGLYCDPVAGAKKPGWPDPYIECPMLEQLYCPSAKPVCVQTGETVECKAKEGGGSE